MNEEDDKPKSAKTPALSLVETWRPPGETALDPYTQKTAQRTVPADLLRLAREQGIYSDGLAAPKTPAPVFDILDEPTHIDTEPPTSGDHHKIAEDQLLETVDQLLETVDQGWEREGD